MPQSENVEEPAANATAEGADSGDSVLSDAGSAGRSVAWIGWLLLFYQIVVLGLLLNPWSSELRIGGWVLVAIEAVLLVFWGLPVFLYQLIWKGRSAKESLRVALWSFVDAIGLAVT